ncbi:MAG: mechanosensitive ion channel [Sphaerospermopsis sp. SIO1G2]|nr:mechanosensitive ion channel [Sphaerospermopsis sp. SIO1G1]NET70130.1 mechanosensitive ion channel [Sphaerospermopsis sp. SIO1G2]
MESIFNALNSLDYSNVPIGKISAVIVVITVTQTLRRFVLGIIVKTIEKFTSQTETTLDDELIAILKPALNWLIFISGFWIVKEIISEDLGPKLAESIGKALNLIVVFIIAYVVYRSASILGQLIANFVLHTETELDELLKPLMPKIFQAVAIIVIAIKTSEIFLGQSAGALVGLLGGAGLTIGLLFKDIVYDWFCTIIIYSDNLYREGDWVGISGVDGFVEIKNIGFRTTTLHLAKWGSIVKMPNSRMITGIVDNWSQNPGEELRWGLATTIRIDGISAKQTARICDAMEEMPKSIAGFDPSCLVRFKKIEGNARVLEIMAFVNDDNLYLAAERNLHLAILELLEQEGIDSLYVELITETGKYNPSPSFNN